MRERLRRALVALAICTLSVLATRWARAHDQRASYARVTFAKGNALTLELLLRISELRAQDPAISRALYRRTLAESVNVLRGTASCRMDPESLSEPPADPGWYRLRLRLLCPGSGTFRLESELGGPGSLIFVRGEGPELVAVGYGEEQALPWLDTRGPPPQPSWVGWLGLGVRHIWAGADHVVFLVLLLLCSARLGELAKTVTGFTLGHSLTLIGANRGWIHVETSIVEALIAFSILLLATELLSAPLPGRSDPKLGGRLRSPPGILFAFAFGLLTLVAWLGGRPGWLSLAGAWLFSVCYLARPRSGSQLWLSSAFGLVHGLGFASALGAGVSDPSAVSWSALIGFNLGVELGQVLVMLPLWWVVSRLQERRAWVAVLSAATASALATRWLLERIG